ncbi:hypothetical protein [Gracilibacillus sp. YIM 98692]|uniref:hypothetical protein n=1 Tax=Gracilibacillus sp. YIM 98692 TaxID=2663532 RepID=UPI0013D87BEE|nr:hypothetical protein [Gracilibacillus sp. YIM 98692]
MSQELFYILSLIITFSSVIVAIVTLRENITTKKASVKPLLNPSRIDKFNSDDNLFSCNFEYPISEELGATALVHFGIKNIGKGPAKNVHVLSFQTDGDDLENFRVGSNSISIPEGGSIPFVIRVGKKDETDYYFGTYNTTIYYEDIFNNGFYLSIRLWIQQSGVTVIEYDDSKEPEWRDFSSVVSREVESHGYFEMLKLEKTLQQNDSNPDKYS